MRHTRLFLGAAKISFDKEKKNCKAPEGQRSTKDDPQQRTTEKPLTYRARASDGEQPSQHTKKAYAANH